MTRNSTPALRKLPPGFFSLVAPKTSFCTILTGVFLWLALVSSVMSLSSGNLPQIPVILGVFSALMAGLTMWLNLREGCLDRAHIWRHGQHGIAHVLGVDVVEGQDHTEAYVVRYRFDMDGLTCVQSCQTLRKEAKDLMRHDELNVVHGHKNGEILSMLMWS